MIFVVMISVVIAVVTTVLVTIFLGVDGNVLFAARTAFTILFADSDLFFVVASTAILAAWKRCREGGVLDFVTFPSDARFRLSFYSDFCYCLLSGNVVPVRRWEKAERNRDPGVKVQIDGGEGAWSRMPFEPLRERFERKTRGDSCFRGEGRKEKGAVDLFAIASIHRRWMLKSKLVMN